MRRFLAGLSILTGIAGAATAGLGAGLLPRSDDGRVVASQPLPVLDPSRPLTVLVPGWLWDPESRRSVPTLDAFAARLNEQLETAYGMTSMVVEYPWSRIPADLIRAEGDFTAYARALGTRQRSSGGCVNFLGHSVGAAMVYAAAARGASMAYLGTLGLPTVARERPPAVLRWANFYTTTYRKDVAGSLWGDRPGADVNIDLRMPHYQFWEAEAMLAESAGSIAATWSICRS